MSAQGWGVLSVGLGRIWDNGDSTKAAPGSAPTPSIQGPRRLSRSRLMVNATPPRALNEGAA